jgi:drug/metabolite transporter (DMT)-like permease
MKASETGHPYLLLFLVILIWGINFIVGRCLSSPVLFGYVHISGVLLGFLRYVVGAITMILILLLQKGRLSPICRQMKPYVKLLGISILASSIFVLSANQSQAYVSSGTTSIIINLCPALVLIYGIVFLEEKLTIKKAVGFTLGFLGGLLFLYNSLKSNIGPHVGLGILLSAIAMIAWAGYTITLHYLEGANRVAVLSIQLTVSSLLIVPFLGIYMMTSPLEFILDIWSILGILFCGAISSGVAYVLYFKTIAAIGAPKSSSFLFLIPFVSLLGDVMLNELPSPITLIGGVVAILGVALIKKDSHAVENRAKYVDPNDIKK